MATAIAAPAALGVVQAQTDAGTGTGAASSAAAAFGYHVFTDARDPPAYRELDPAERATVDLGHAVFNTQWVPAGTLNAERRDGLGPLFNASACDACHRPTLNTPGGLISPYTDLQRHDLGVALADRDVSGHVVPSRWRTAPLWEISYRIRTEHVPTFVHDGRERSIEEAIFVAWGRSPRRQTAIRGTVTRLPG